MAAYNWTLSEADLRAALFGAGWRKPELNEWCDHVPMRVGPQNTRLCRCGQLVITHDEMTKCQQSWQFVELVRQKIGVLEGGSMFGVTEALKQEQQTLKAKDLIAKMTPVRKSSAGVFVPFFEQLKGINLDPRWKLTVIDNPENRFVTVRLLNTETGQTSAQDLSLQTLHDCKPQELTDMLVGWIVSVAGPPIPPAVAAPVQKPYTCCHPGCNKKYGPADWCPNGHDADTWADVMIMARARDLTAKNERMKASLDEAHVDVKLPPDKTRLINLDDE